MQKQPDFYKNLKVDYYFLNVFDLRYKLKAPISILFIYLLIFKTKVIIVYTGVFSSDLEKIRISYLANFKKSSLYPKF